MLMDNLIEVGNPISIAGLQLWLDSTDSSSMTKAYSNITETATGTSGTTTITASGTVANIIEAGMIIRIKGTDLYTVASVSTVTITTVQTLSQSYVADVIALDKVSQWSDKSGQGNHVTQATAARQPVFNPTGQNGKGTLFFNGANGFNLPAAIYTAIPNADSTFFTIAKRNAETAGSNRLISMTEGGSTRVRVDYMATAGNVGFLNRTANTGGAAYTGSTNTNFNVIRSRHNGVTLASTVNNNTEVTSSDGQNENGCDAGTIGIFLDGGTLGLLGSMGSIACYNRNLSVYEYGRVDRFLGRTFAITIV